VVSLAVEGDSFAWWQIRRLGLWSESSARPASLASRFAPTGRREAAGDHRISDKVVWSSLIKTHRSAVYDIKRNNTIAACYSLRAGMMASRLNHRERVIPALTDH
jgi:hypothetical protein